MGETGEGIEALLDAVIDGRCDEAGLRRFEVLVRDDPRVRAAYLDQMRMHALLEWHHGRVELRVDRPGSGRARVRARGRRWWGLAAVVLVGVGLAVLAARSAGRGGATLVEARDVVWAEGQPPVAEGARLGHRRVRCLSGALTLAFGSGARVALEGPADLRVESGSRLRVDRGRLTARVDGGVKGFTVETPAAVVVDRGTEFGVEVDGAGQAVVVVFEGVVELARPGSAGGATPWKRLGRGEAVRADRSGRLSRVVMIDRRAGGDRWSTGPSNDPEALIRSVTDNVRDPESPLTYQVVRGGLDEDAPAYVDRFHQWNGLLVSGLPAFLRGADYVMTPMEAKAVGDLEVTIEAARGATLYVLFDDRQATPAWLAGPFSDTGANIGLDEESWPDRSLYTLARGPGRSIDRVFSVWKREVRRGESVTLGAITGPQKHRAMYAVAAVARP